MRAAPDEAAGLLVVGHNPGLEDLAETLIGSGNREARRRIATQFPTAALAVIDFEAPSWAAIAEEEGRLERFVCPRDLGEDA